MNKSDVRKLILHYAFFVHIERLFPFRDEFSPSPPMFFARRRALIAHYLVLSIVRIEIRGCGEIGKNPGAAIQYRGIVESTSSDQDLIPPLRFLTLLKPFIFKNSTALALLTPVWQ